MRFRPAAFEGWIGDVVLILLALMSAGPVGITINRIRQCKAARKDSMDFRRRVGRTLHDHKLDDLISIAKGHRNPGAVVIASGLVAFQKARLLGLDVFAFEAAKRVAKLSARDVHISCWIRSSGGPIAPLSPICSSAHGTL